MFYKQPDPLQGKTSFFNSIFFGDTGAVLGEARRVARLGAQIVIVAWASPEQMQTLAYHVAIDPLLPPVQAQINPFAEPKELETRARRAELRPERVFDIDWTWEYPDRQTLLRGWLSAGPISNRECRREGAQRSIN